MSQIKSRLPIISEQSIERKILSIREQKVMIDSDLAKLYGVSTKRLNEQVKRNRERFPEDFMFQLSRKEKEEVVANCDHLQVIKFSKSMPYVFTEHGATMLASVLNSSIAVQMSVQIVRVFLRLRQIFLTQADFKNKIETLERKYQYHDERLNEIFFAIKKLMSSPPKQKKEIGFHTRLQ